MKKAFILSIAILFSTGLKAQHTVSGLITDFKDTLLKGVSVFIPEFQKYCVSEEGGTYILRNVGIGTVNIQFTKIGYKTVVKTISTKDSALVINIKMEPTTTELEEVVVTSNSSKLPDNLPYSVTTYSNEDFRKSGAISLMSSLSSQPGIDKISVGNGISKPVIRGLSFSRILLYQNGTRIENQPWDDRHDLGISDDGLDKVEVVKGPSGLIYGADALGGALIFIDEKPAAGGTIKGDVNIGFHTNTLGYNTNAGVRGTSDKGIFYSFRLGQQTHTSFIQGVSADSVKKNSEFKDFAANSKFNNQNAKATVGISKRWGVSKITYSYFSQKIGIIENEGSSPNQSIEEFNTEQRDPDVEAPYQDVTTQVVSNENTIVVKHSKLNLNVAYQLNDRKEYEPVGAPGSKQKETAIGLKLNTITYDAKWSSDAEKKFGVTIGSQGMFQKNENFGLDGLVPDATVNDIAGYALARYDLPKWNILGGIRVDARHIAMTSYHGASDTANNRPELDFAKDYSPLNGSIGIAYHPLEDLTLKVNGASGFSAPNYAELGTYGKHEGTYRFEIGNPNLDIEQNSEIDGGVLWESKSVDINLSGFYNHINNYIYINNSGRDTVLSGDTTHLPVYNFVQSNAALSGLEATLDIHPTELKWLDLLGTVGMTKGTLDKGGNLPYIPAKKMTGEIKLHAKNISWVQSPYFSFVVSDYFAQRDTAEFELSSDSHVLFDARVGFALKWKKQLVEVNLGVTNLLNTPYYNHLSLIRTIFVREMGRDIFINLRFPFGIKGNS